MQAFNHSNRAMAWSSMVDSLHDQNDDDHVKKDKVESCSFVRHQCEAKGDQCTDIGKRH